MSMTGRQLNRDAARTFARYTGLRAHHGRLEEQPAGTWIRLGRDDDWLEVCGHVGGAVVLAKPGQPPHLLMHSPYGRRVEVLPP